jgi:hypothetical protein
VASDESNFGVGGGQPLRSTGAWYVSTAVRAAFVCSVLHAVLMACLLTAAGMAGYMVSW